MRASVASLSKKLISTFFAATLALGLVPAAAFAVDDDGLQSIPEGSEGAVLVASSAEEEGRDVLALPSDTDPSADGDGADFTSEDGFDSDDGLTTAMTSADVVNQTMPLTKPVAQQESTRSYFLAQTLESTKTVPIVSANLPLDKGANQRPQAGADGGTTVGSEDEVTDGDPSVSAEGDGSSEDEGGDDSDESDLDGSTGTLGVSPESTVVGSFIYRGITYAVEPGGESVAVVAADYAKLPEEFVEAQAIVLPSVATADGVDYYSVTRIADDAFAGINGAAVAAAGNGQDASASSAVQQGDKSLRHEAQAVSESAAGDDDVDAGATWITAIVLPASVVEMGDDAFTGADVLQYVFVVDENPVYSSYDGALYDADLTTLLYVPEARSGEFFIAPSVTAIRSDAFSRSTIDAVIIDPGSLACQLLLKDNKEYKNARGDILSLLTQKQESTRTQDAIDIKLYAGLVHSEDETSRGLKKAHSVLKKSEMALDYGMESSYASGDRPGDQRTICYSSSVEKFFEPYQEEATAYFFQDVSTYPYWYFRTNRTSSTNYNYDLAGGVLIRPRLTAEQLARAYVTRYENVYGGWLRCRDLVGGGSEDHYGLKTLSSYQAGGITSLEEFDMSTYSFVPVPFGTSLDPIDDKTHYYFANGYRPTELVGSFVLWDAASHGATMRDLNATEVPPAYDQDVVSQFVPIDDPSTEVVENTVDVPSQSDLAAPSGFEFKGWAAQAKDASGNFMIDELGNRVLQTSYTRYDPATKQTFVQECSGGTYLKAEDGTGTNLVIEEDTTFYAIYALDLTWDASTYGGAFADGSIDERTQEVVYGAKTVVPALRSDEEGWEFAGWAVRAKDEEGFLVPDADALEGVKLASFATTARDGTISVTSANCGYAASRENARLYAVWNVRPDWSMMEGAIEGMSFDATGLPATVVYGTRTATPHVASPESHHFDKWIAEDGTQSTEVRDELGQVTGCTIVVKSPRIIAHWAPNEGTVVLNGQGTDASPVADQDTYAIYGQALRLHPSASDGSSWDEGRALRAPTRQGYVFAGYWNTRYTETEGAIESDVPRTDGTTVPSVEAKCYLEVDADGNLALVDGLVWDVTDPARQLFAHWRYDVLFDANAAGSSSGTASVRHKGSIMPMGPVATQDGTYQSDVWGNRYYYADYDGDDLSITKANALYGAPVKLPWATERTDADGRPAGYDDTCAWKASLSEGSPVISVDTEGFTVEEDGEAKVALAVAPGSDGTVTLYADWTDKAHEFVVTLDAGSLALSSDGSAWENETLTGVVYDRTLREVGVTGVGVPYRNGYTFAGFYTQAEGGSSYIDAAGMPVSGKPWAETAEVGEDGARHVTLYARWMEDGYRIVYDLSLPAEGNDALAEKTPGHQTIEGSAPVASQSWAYGSVPAHDGGALPVAQTSPVTAQGSFFRNGYDFQGWYWVDENGAAVMVSSADGSPRGTFAPSLAWQRAHKGGLASDAAATSGTLVLYAAWTPKVYGLVFDLGYQEQADRVLPDETMAGMISPNEVKERNGAYYYEVAYEAELTPFFEGVGSSAVPCAPTDAPYTFAGWRVKGGLGDGSALALTDAAGDVSEAALSGAFMPAYPLSTRVVGDGGAPATITYRGEWTAPEPVKVRLRADAEGDPVRGRFITASFADIDPALVESATEQELVLKDVGYALGFDLMGARSPYRPRASAGYTLAGFLRTDADGRILDAQGRPTAETDPYDGTGELKSGLPLVSSLSKLTEDAYAVAVYSRNRMIVELDMSEIPQKLGYEGYTLYTEVDGAYEEGWSIDGSVHDSPVYAFDVTAPPFALPDDVVVAGYAFRGWERAGSAEMVPDGYVFDPSRIAADPNLSRQTFKPVFEEKVYEVSFLDNHADGQGGSRKATVTFEGAIVDAGDFAGLEGYEVGATLPMASVPEPETAPNDPSHTGSDAAYEHYHSYPFSLWRIGSPYSTQADVQERSANEAVSADEWSAWVERFSQAAPGTRAKTETLAVYAVWARAISAVLPLRADVALDADTGSVALPDEAHAVYGVGLQEGEALEVASLRCEGMAVSVFDMRVGAPVRLTVFADAASKPSMGAPSVDADGFIRGDYGGNARGKLSVDLGRSASSFGKGELEAAGFRPFTAGEAAEGSSGRLAMRFGLDLDGCAIEEVRALRAQLPDPNGELDENGWTRAALPVARLLYTVQIAQ